MKSRTKIDLTNFAKAKFDWKIENYFNFDYELTGGESTTPPVSV